MRRSEPTTGLRISLRLEPAIGIEGLILNRLSRVPNARRQDWLRGLLTQGFLAECQALRGLQQGAPIETPLLTSAACAQAIDPSVTPTTRSIVEGSAETEPLTEAEPVPCASFTALRKMIG